jgi:hypothetical protein
MRSGDSLVEFGHRLIGKARRAASDWRIVSRMGGFSVKVIVAVSAAVLLGCSNGPVEYATDNGAGVLHQISTDPAEIFRNKVNLEADLEARGVEHPVGNTSWRDYWTKLIAYWTGQGSVGTNKQVAAYIVQQRRARSLPPL